MSLKNSSNSTLRRIHLDDSPTSSHRNVRSVMGGLSVISTTDDVEESASVLESIAVRISAAGNEGRESDCGDFISKGERGEVDRYATWTECLGFESLSETAGGCDVMEEPPVRSTAGSGSRSSNTEWRGRKTRATTLRNYPPLLSTLNKNGRPIFDFRKVRKEGLLQIMKVPSNRPEVRSLRGNGRLRILLINAPQDDEEEGEKEERESGECDEEATTTTTEDQGRLETQVIHADRQDKEKKEKGDDQLRIQLINTNGDETKVEREGGGADSGWWRCEGGRDGDGCFIDLLSQKSAMIC